MGYRSQEGGKAMSVMDSIEEAYQEQIAALEAKLTEKCEDCSYLKAFPVAREEIAALTAENERLKSDHACGDCPMLNGVVSENNKICQTVDKLRIENQRLMEALVDIHDYWNRDSNDKAMYDACNHAIDVAYNALIRTEGGGE
jgi:hypothetical protein